MMIPGSSGSPANAVASQAGAVLNAVLWDTGSGGAIGYTVGQMALQGTFVATVQVRGTLDDGITWWPITLSNAASVGATADTLSPTSVAAYEFAAMFPRIQAIVTAYTSGSVSCPVVFEDDVSARARSVAATLIAGSAVIGQVNLGPSPTVGVLTKHRLALSAASVNSTLVVAGAKKLYGGVVTNTNAAARFIKFYDKATAPTVGTDTPVLTLLVPANTSLDLWKFFTDFGRTFALGIGYGLTAAFIDSDTTVVGTDMQVELDYA